MVRKNVRGRLLMLKLTCTLAITTALLLTAPMALAEETVTFELRTAADGMAVCPGDTVAWEIWINITTTNNEGLALACVDLVQDGGNPAMLNIPFADEIPAGMANFSRPEGISNPGESGNSSGYIGVQRGVEGEKNLIQLGGGQNTFGAAGSSMGTNPNLVANVAKGVDTLLVAGSFTAPAVAGSYTFSLQNPIANTIAELNTPPDHSPVESAAVSFVTESITFVIPRTGDLDGDGDIDLSDLAALLGSYGGASGFDCTNGDLDGDGDVDLSDLAALLGNYGT